MRLLYGTKNRAKLKSMRRVTRSVGIEIFGLDELAAVEPCLETGLPQIDESGKNPLENAVIKAKAYYKALGIPLFSCDSGLYFDGFSDGEQPGTHVRRVGGTELTDSQMVERYSRLAKSRGGRLTARYRNAICLVLDEDTVLSRMDGSLEIGPFYLVDRPHPFIEPGFPLDSLSVDIATGKYYQDLGGGLAVDKGVVEQGFAEFFREAMRGRLA